jgi:phosphoribosyl-AMP cyclohydrolase
LVAAQDIENGTQLELDFARLSRVARAGMELVPVVLQNADTSEVLFVAYASEAALEETLRTRTAVLWSTSRGELWRKGATSGDVLDLVDVWINCEQNSLLYRVRPRQGGVCHTRNARGDTRSRCFYRRLADAGGQLIPDEQA